MCYRDTYTLYVFVHTGVGVRGRPHRGAVPPLHRVSAERTCEHACIPCAHSRCSRVFPERLSERLEMLTETLNLTVARKD